VDPSTHDTFAPSRSTVNAQARPHLTSLAPSLNCRHFTSQLGGRTPISAKQLGGNHDEPHIRITLLTQNLNQTIEPPIHGIEPLHPSTINRLSILNSYLVKPKQHTLIAMSTATTSTANSLQLIHTTTSTAPSPIADSPLFKLPAELRIRIYADALYSDDNGECKVTRKHGIPEAPLLSTCKVIRGEAISMFYTLNSFRLAEKNSHPADFAMVQRKKKSLEAQGVPIGDKDSEIIDFGYFCYLLELRWCIVGAYC
jgi:hypothetical protein